MKTFRAHYDGKVIVPEEPLDLPLNKTLPFAVELVPPQTEDPNDLPLEEWLERLDRTPPIVKGFALPEEAFLRENMYADDDGI
jgi:hypothetical protein